MTFRPAVLRLLPALLLAACGNSGNSADTTASASGWPSFEAPAAPAQAARAPLPRACELLSAEQASALLNAEAGLVSDDAEACLWSGSEGVGRMSLLSVMVGDNDDLAMAQQVFGGIVGLHGNVAGLVNEQVGEKTKKSGQEIDDLGDEAWLSGASIGESFGPHGVAAQQLVVRKGTRLLTLNVTGTSRIDGLGQRMEALARSAVPRL